MVFEKRKKIESKFWLQISFNLMWFLKKEKRKKVESKFWLQISFSREIKEKKLLI